MKSQYAESFLLGADWHSVNRWRSHANVDGVIAATRYGTLKHCGVGVITSKVDEKLEFTCDGIGRRVAKDVYS